jgi:hypothetical protein
LNGGFLHGGGYGEIDAVQRTIDRDCLIIAKIAQSFQGRSGCCRRDDPPNPLQKGEPENFLKSPLFKGDLGVAVSLVEWGMGSTHPKDQVPTTLNYRLNQ